MPFDIIGFRNKHIDYYGDAPLDKVAKDVYTRAGYDKEYPDFDTWAKQEGVDQHVQNDLTRRNPQKEGLGTELLKLPRSFLQGAAEGITTELPSMVGGAIEFAASHTPFKGIEETGKSIKDWAEEKRQEVYGPEIERTGLDRIVYEGTKMLAPSLIPGGIVGTAARGLKGVSALTKAGKMVEATAAARSATNIAGGSVAGLFGLSQAQQTKDTAEKEGIEPGIAPYLTGAIEAAGEFLGTKYLAKLFRLDEAEVVKRGIKELTKDLIKTVGVEVGTEIGQAGGEAAVEKFSGIRPSASPIGEAIDVIGPTTFMTLLTAGLAGGANKLRETDPESARYLEKMKIGAITSMSIKEGLETGQLDGGPFTPGNALEIIREGQNSGIYDSDSLERFKERYPQLRDGLNGIIAESVIKKIDEVASPEPRPDSISQTMAGMKRIKKIIPARNTEEDVSEYTIPEEEVQDGTLQTKTAIGAPAIPGEEQAVTTPEAEPEVLGQKGAVTTPKESSFEAYANQRGYQLNDLKNDKETLYRLRADYIKDSENAEPAATSEGAPKGDISDDAVEYSAVSRKEHVIQLANEFKKNGVVKVEDGNLYYIVHKSTKEPGKFQVTTFDDKGPISDTATNTLKEALEELTNSVSPFRYNRPDLPDTAPMGVLPDKAEYTYEYKYRPMSIGTQPEGFIRSEDGGKFGRVVYNRPLRKHELDKFELKPIGLKEITDKEAKKTENKGKITKTDLPSAETATEPPVSGAVPAKKLAAKGRSEIINRGFPQEALFGNEKVTLIGVVGNSGRRGEVLGTTLEDLNKKAGQLVIRKPDGTEAIVLDTSIRNPETGKLFIDKSPAEEASQAVPAVQGVRSLGARPGVKPASELSTPLEDAKSGNALPIIGKLQSSINNVPDGAKGKKQLLNALDQLNESPDDPVKSLTVLQRIKNNLRHMGDGNEQIQKDVSSIEQHYKEQGYEISDLLGQKYSDRLRVIATFKPGEGTWQPATITRIIKPQVNKDGVMVSAAEVEVTDWGEKPTPTEAAEETPAPRSSEAAKMEPTGEGKPEEMTRKELEAKYQKASDIVDGRKVRSEIPNMDSIEASLEKPNILPGIYEIPLSEFGGLTGKHYSSSGTKRISELADEISINKEINPLIVVLDKEGPYILEGATRAEALYKLGAKSLPAKIVLDEDSLSEGKKLGTVNIPAKEPWMMTRDEFAANQGKDSPYIQQQRDAIVKKAISEGLPVPQNVLNDYPDLIPKKEEERTGKTEAIPPVQTQPGVNPVVEIPVDQIKLSKDVPQFKTDADERGIVQEIQGKEYRRVPMNAIIVWQRKNGDLEVITGRHRLDLAKRLGEKTIPAQIVKESEGFDTQKALTFDAEQNILDNQGTENDYANYFRNTELTEKEAGLRGLLRGAKASAAWILGKHATDQTFNSYSRTGEINFKQAVAISKAAPNDERLQAAGRSFAVKNPRATDSEIENFVHALSLVKNTPKQVQGDLFGFDDSAIRTAEIQAKKAAAVIARLRRDSSNINAAIRGEGKLELSKEGATEYGIKDPKDKEQLKEARNKILSKIGEWEKWYVNPELVKQLTEETTLPPAPKEAPIKTEKTEAGEQSVIPGASAAETFNLTNPETEISPKLREQVTPKNEEMFGAPKDVSFQRGKSSGLQQSQVQAVIDQALKSIPNPPQVNIVQSSQDCPEAVQRIMERDSIDDAMGFTHNGEVYLVSDNIRNEEETIRTLAHELTHSGLGKFFQRQTQGKIMPIRVKYEALMDAIYQAHGEEIEQLVKTTHRHLKIRTVQGRRQACEEWLCNQSYDSQPKWYDKLVAIFNDLLRAVGLNVKLSDAEVRVVLQDAFKEFGGEGINFKIAHHGTPHIWMPEPGFPHGRPRLDKIGTGEGAAAFGWGFYTAEPEPTARTYAESLAKNSSFDNGYRYVIREDNYDGETVVTVTKIEHSKSPSGANYDDYSSDVEKTGHEEFTSREDAVKYLKDNNYIPQEAVIRKDGYTWTAESRSPQIYKLEIPDDVIPKLLDWDKSLSEQSEYVKKALAGATQNTEYGIGEYGARMIRDYARRKYGTMSDSGKADGLVLYSILVGWIAQNKTGETQTALEWASKYLASIGIPGNKYLDQMSREQGEGSYNYVIWDQKVLDRIALLERNGEKLDAIREEQEFQRSPVSFMTAWHGSPHDFDKFSKDKIGTGEGAQAYGYGLYFAGKKEVGEYYRKSFIRGLSYGNREVSVDRDTVDVRYVDSNEFVTDNAARLAILSLYHNMSLRQTGGEFIWGDNVQANIKMMNDAQILLSSGVVKKAKGRLYQVELAPNEDEYLLWDKPLSEQSEKVKAALKSHRIPKALPFKGNTGRGLYHHVAAWIGQNDANGGVDGERKASELLHSLGIRGIKYLDGTSRNTATFKITPPSQTVAGDWMVKSDDYNSKGVHFKTEQEAKAYLKEQQDKANYNYVIFSDEDIEVTAKFQRRSPVRRSQPMFSRSDNPDYKWWEGMDIQKQLESLPLKPWQKPRDFIAMGYVPITRAEADKMYYDGLDIFVAHVNIKGELDTTGNEGIFMRPLSFYGYEYEKYNGTIGRETEARKRYMEYRQRYNDSQRAIPDRNRNTEAPMGRDSALREEEAPEGKVAESENRYSGAQGEEPANIPAETTPKAEGGKNPEGINEIVESLSQYNHRDIAIIGNSFSYGKFEENLKKAIKKELEISDPEEAHSLFRSLNLSSQGYLSNYNIREAIDRIGRDKYIEFEHKDIISQAIYDTLDFSHIDTEQLKKLPQIRAEQKEALKVLIDDGKYGSALAYNRHAAEFNDALKYTNKENFELQYIDYETGKLVDNQPMFSGFDLAQQEHANNVKTQRSKIKIIKKDTDLPNLILPSEGEGQTKFQRRPPQDPSVSRDPLNTYWEPLENTKWDTMLYSLVDKNIDAKDVVSAIRKFTRKDVSEAEDIKLKETNYSGRLDARVKDFMQKEFAPVITALAKEKVSRETFEEYLLMRHAKEANEYYRRNKGTPDGGSGVLDKEVDEYLRALDAELKQKMMPIAEMIDKITHRSAQILIEYGVESNNTINKWFGSYQHYVPLSRDDDPIYGRIKQTGFSISGASSARRQGGSDKPALNILANIAEQREKYIKRGEKNIIAKALYSLAKKNPNPEFWEAAKPQVVPKINVATGETVPVLDESYKKDDMVIMSRQIGPDGEIIEKGIRFNEKNPRAARMALSLKNLDLDSIGAVLGTMAKVTRYMASINTQYNPVFGITNFFRDLGTMAFNLSTTPISGKQAQVLKGIGPAMMGITKALRGDFTSPQSQIFKDFQMHGGQTGYVDLYKAAEDRTKDIDKQLKLIEGKNPVAGLVWWAKDALSNYNTSIENAVRLSAYEVGIANGMSKDRAAAMAKDLTVNFNRKGQWASQAGAMYAFFNASVQGTMRMYETFTGPKGKKIIIGGMIFGAVQALALAAAGFGDDEPPDFVRERNIIIPIGGKRYVTIPMPLGFNILPNIGRIPMEIVLTGGKDADKKIASMLGVVLETFNPMGSSGLSIQTFMPTIADPFVALAENKDWTGKPIYRENFNSLDPAPGHSRAKDTSSMLGRALSSALNLATGGSKYVPGYFSPTPDQIDYLVGQATGGVGRELSKTSQTIQAVFSGEELPAHKIPVVGRLYGNAEGSTHEGSRFYDNIKMLNRHEREIKGLQKDGKPIHKYIKDHPEARYYAMANQIEGNIRKLKANKDLLKQRNAKKEYIVSIDKQITAQMKRLNDVIMRAER
jgi:hypothetical protein